MIARYRCRLCGHTWLEPPHKATRLPTGNIRMESVTCPKCDHVYVDWLNYDDHDWLGDGNNGRRKR